MLEDNTYVYYIRAFLSIILITVVLFLLLKVLERKKRLFLQDKNIKDIKIVPIDRDTKLIILKYKDKDYLMLKSKNFVKVIDKTKNDEKT